MCGFKCSVFALLVTLPCILKANEQNFRSKREEPCGGDIDLELMGGVAEIQLRTGVKNGVEFYRVFEDCTWTLKTADDHFMILKSDYFSVEKSENCFSDYVKITEKGVDETTSRHCGFDPLTYITFGNIIKLQFKSDGSSEYMGFKFTVKSVKKFLDDTFCIGSILGGEDSSIVNKDISGDNCFYRIQAPKHNDITLTLKMLDFGSASCEEESIIIYEGNSTQGRPLGTICSDNDLGILPYRASSMFIEYRNPLELDGGRFEIEYMFVEDNLISSTSHSSVRENDAPCGEEIDLELIDGVAEIQLRTELFNGIEFYRVNENCTWTLKTAQDNFMILKSDYFIVEESENCIWDYVEITEKGVDGTTSKYCGWDPLTYITFGSEIQLQFKSDVSYGYKGFKFIIDASKRGGDDSKCIGSILGGEDSRIMNKDDLEEDCFYRIQ
ncbi:cubilin-like, partial [Ruditapes philippinarum]|uniref:cubilin-like n=1 Tax=Ruditapes philippinarum TaxID=129788 RepID=UPI00295BC378